MNILIITSCPSGLNSSIAGTLLEAAAIELNWDVLVEICTNEQSPELFTKEQIQDADLVAIATDKPFDTKRFSGKPIYRGTIAEAMEDPQEWLVKAEQQATIEHSAEEQPSTSAEGEGDGPMKIVAVTACPTGVAHTFMAAEALKRTCASLGHQIAVETRGSVGAKDQLSAEDIAEADIVILAVDIEVDSSPFSGKRIYRTSTGNALKKSVDVINSAIKEAGIETTTDAEGSGDEKSFKKEKTGAYKHLMTGVSFMLPVVVAGGLIIALSFVFGIEAFKEEGTLAAALMTIGGGTAFALMIPVLAGYIAYSIADRPGLAPGLIGGMLASNIGSGFLGGILAGFIAGYVAKFLVEHVKLPRSLEALKPILIIPLVASLVTGLAMIYVVGGPVASIMKAMTTFLNDMGSGNAVLLGIILGSMMCFDLGGPVNKAAYTFGVGLLASQTYTPMAAVMAAGMVPAIGMGLATFMARRKFTEDEHEAGRASFVLGLCFISEGAIPFAAKDPLRVIPACMLGGALTGALSMLFNAELLAPHGGVFVLLIPNAISHVVLYIGAIVTGSLVTAVVYTLLKDRTFFAAKVKS